MLRRVAAVGVGLPLHSAVGRLVPEFLRWSRSAALPRLGRGFPTTVRMRPHGSHLTRAGATALVRLRGLQFDGGQNQRQPVQEVGVDVRLYRPVP